ncbi:hypothetical protein [Actinoallomurus rhizosphaericola]|nr:hypothetical protein [Actinoallomurus rhizosphaericola]
MSSMVGIGEIPTMLLKGHFSPASVYVDNGPVLVSQEAPAR